MNFPQFRARVRSQDLFVWRWSLRSPAEAQLLAGDAARRIVDRFRSGIRLPRFGAFIQIAGLAMAMAQCKKRKAISKMGQAI